MERAGAQVTVVSVTVKSAQRSGAASGCGARREPVWRLSGMWSGGSFGAGEGGLLGGDGFTGVHVFS